MTESSHTPGTVRDELLREVKELINSGNAQIDSVSASVKRIYVALNGDVEGQHEGLHQRVKRLEDAASRANWSVTTGISVVAALASVTAVIISLVR